MNRSPRLRSTVLLLPVVGVVLWLVWSATGLDATANHVDIGARDDVAAIDDSTAEVVAIDLAEQEVQRSRVASAPETDATPVASSAATSWLLRGSVVDASGRSVADALVGLVSLHEGSPGHRGDRAVVSTGEDGAFELAVPEWARDARVLLIARRKGQQPFSDLVQVDRAFLASDHELALGVGHEISGRVVRDGLPIVGARVSIDVAYGTGGIFNAGSEAWWANGRLEEKHGEAHTSVDGSFHIAGMGPYEHRVEVHADQRDVPRVAGHLFEITAPDSRVYDLTGARVAVTVTDRSGLVSGAKVHVSSGGHGVMVESADAPVVVEVPPHAQVSVEVSHPLSRPVRADLESAAAGGLSEVVVPLDRVTRPSLTVFVPGAERIGVDRLRLRMQLVHGFSDTELEAVATGAADTFRVPVVPLDPGKYSLVLEPNGDGGSGRYLAPRTQEIELPASGEAHAEFELELGGRCDVRISSPRSGDWSASYRVVDSDGQRRFERHIYHSAPRQVGDGDWEESIMETDLSFESFTRFGSTRFSSAEDVVAVAKRCGVLPAGTYALEVESEGHAEWRGAITIEAGRTTRVDVALTAAD